MIKPFLSKQFLLFLFVGGFSAAVNWGSRLLLRRWCHFYWAVPLAYGIGMAVAFTLYRKFVFRGSSREVKKQARDFALTNLGALPVVWGLSLALNAWLKRTAFATHSEAIAHAIAIAVPSLGTFLMYKYVAFRAALS